MRGQVARSVPDEGDAPTVPPRPATVFLPPLGVGPFPPVYGHRQSLEEELASLEAEMPGLAGPRPLDLDEMPAPDQPPPVAKVAPREGFSTIPEALEAIRTGQIVIVVDDEDRENEGDFVMAADLVTPEAVNLMITHGRGLLCLALTGDRLDELDIRQMVPEAAGREETAFAVSIDLEVEGSTGISAFDRARTVHAALDPATRPRDLRRPGHVFPLRARARGVLDRPGHTEASVDLARMAGRTPAGVICEIMNPDGSMARLPDLLDVADRLGMHLVTIEDLIAYRRRHEVHVTRLAETALPTSHGEFRAIAFRSALENVDHLALVFGEVEGTHDVLVRLHSECLTGDVFGSHRCDCGPQLEESLRRIAVAGRGAVIYLRGHEGRGIGLVDKLRAYVLQEAGHDTVEANLELGHPADIRDYDGAAQILQALGIRSVRLLTNNPAKRRALELFGIAVTAREALEVSATVHNQRYLVTKRDKLGHHLTIDLRL